MNWTELNWTERLAKVWNLGNAKLQTRNCGLPSAVCGLPDAKGLYYHLLICKNKPMVQCHWSPLKLDLDSIFLSRELPHSLRDWKIIISVLLHVVHFVTNLSKNLFWRPASICPFQNGSSTSGILNKSTVSAKFTCDDFCGESESYWEIVMWWYFARIKCGSIVSGWLWIVLSVTWVIVWFPEVVDRQISGISWRSCHKNIVYKHENTL